MTKAQRQPNKPKANRTRIVQFRLTEADYVKLKQEAQQAGLAPNECARVKTTGSVVKVRQTPGLPFEVTHELGRIGVNLNQVARQLNTTGEHDDAQLAEACARMNEVLTVIMAAITG